MDIQQDLAIRGESIQWIYDAYLNERFLVNRRYQRKLVWTVEEKEAFVDSIRQGFPIPIILVAEVKYDGQTRFELIDGMQRLNAIVSFIEGEFHLKGEYFDLETIVESKLLLDKGQIIQRQPILNREICKKIASYKVPLSVSKLEGQNKIDETFRRINTNGRHLSPQELRQAGMVSLFSQVVRNISSKIRGDVSHSDRLLLNNMKNISITNRGLSHYGINIYDIPWVAQKVISFDNIRDSRDEELVAHLLTYMLLGEKANPTAYALDNCYGFQKNETSDYFSDIEEQIRKIGQETLEQQFLAVYDEVTKVLKASYRSSGFDKLLFRGKLIKISQHYQVIFLAFYELLVKRCKKIQDYQELARRLYGIGDSVIKIKEFGGEWDRESRLDYINAVIAHIQDAFTERTNDDPMLDSGITRLENLLRQSQTEQSLYDFKIGFHDLDTQGLFNRDAFQKILKTLTAMANHGPGSVGYVVVGIADKQADANRHKNIYGNDPKVYSNFHITGIQDEANRYHNGLDSYFRKIGQYIKTEPISPENARNELLTDVTQ